jgi:DNA polymerase-4
MSVRQARQLCPELCFVLARPKTYVELHHRIRAAIEQCVPVHAALSVDEFCCALQGRERSPQNALAIAQAVKQALRGVGSTLRCSIGLGPNRLIAKTAAGMQKPDGLTLIERHQLPHALQTLELRDLPGIGARMERRLHQAGVSTMRQLCALSRTRMESLWGGVTGTRLWLELRGEDLPETQITSAQTISRQHILPPAQRTREGGRQIAFKMLQDCVRRLRKKDLWARGLGLAVYYQDHEYVFEAHHRIAPCRDAITLQQHLAPLWEGSPAQKPSGLCVFLFDLTPQPEVTNLFTPRTETRREAAAQAMDRIQQRFGRNAVYLASIHGAQEEAPTRISFGPPPPLEEF